VQRVCPEADDEEESRKEEVSSATADQAMQLLQRFSCVVEGCPWTFTQDVTPVSEGALASVFGPGVMTAVARVQKAWQAEEKLDRHFGSHPVLDFVKTIAKLRARLTRYEGEE
jgi:hypothetical protein